MQEDLTRPLIACYDMKLGIVSSLEFVVLLRLSVFKHMKIEVSLCYTVGGQDEIYEKIVFPYKTTCAV